MNIPVPTLFNFITPTYEQNTFQLTWKFIFAPCHTPLSAFNPCLFTSSSLCPHTFLYIHLGIKFYFPLLWALNFLYQSYTVHIKISCATFHTSLLDTLQVYKNVQRRKECMKRDSSRLTVIFLEYYSTNIIIYTWYYYFSWIFWVDIDYHLDIHMFACPF